MNKSKLKLNAIIHALETLIDYGHKTGENKTQISCEVILEDLYALRRLLHEDLHS